MAWLPFLQGCVVWYHKCTSSKPLVRNSITKAQIWHLKRLPWKLFVSILEPCQLTPVYTVTRRQICSNSNFNTANIFGKRDLRCSQFTELSKACKCCVLNEHEWVQDKNRGAKEHDDNKNGSIKTQLSAPLSKMKNSNKYFLR